MLSTRSNSLAYILIYLCIVSVMPGCEKKNGAVSTHTEAEPGSFNTTANDYLILGDRSNAIREKIYIIHGDTVFVSDHVFPGYTDRQYFSASIVSDDFVGDLAVFNQLTPPFIPGGPSGYCKVVDELGHESATYYFDAKDGAPGRRMNQIETYLERSLRKVEHVPEWIKDEPEVLRLLGLTVDQ